MIPKTNPMRHLDKLGIPYEVHTYPADSGMTGTDIASLLGEDPPRVFKTLVTIAKSKKHYVFVIPVEMLPSKELLGLTGYVHGGCSPLCMKREMVTVIDSTIKDGERFYVSAGKVGCQLELSSKDFLSAGDFITADITRPKAVERD